MPAPVHRAANIRLVIEGTSAGNSQRACCRPFRIGNIDYSFVVFFAIPVCTPLGYVAGQVVYTQLVRFLHSYRVSSSVTMAIPTYSAQLVSTGILKSFSVFAP